MAQYCAHFFAVHLELQIMQRIMSVPPHAQSHTARPGGGGRGGRAGGEARCQSALVERRGRSAGGGGAAQNVLSEQSNIWFSQASQASTWGAWFRARRPTVKRMAEVRMEQRPKARRAKSESPSVSKERAQSQADCQLPFNESAKAK